MTDFARVYQTLLTGDISVLTEDVIMDMNSATLAILNAAPAERSNLMYHDCEQIILISNLLYNNTDQTLLPLDDGTYDKLQIVYKDAFPNSYKIGAPPVSFGESNERVNETKPLRRIFRPIEYDRRSMLFADTLLQPMAFKDPEVRDVPESKQRKKNVAHLHPQLAGTLDKCTWVTVEDARRFNPDLIKDPNVQIFERDFLRKYQNVLASTFEMVVMFKYDGCAIEAECTDRVICARTRGDTAADQTTDVSDILRGYQFPKAHELFGSADDPRRKQPVAIQFEAIIDANSLYQLNMILGKSYVNARAAINGIIGRNDAARFRDFITLVPVDIEMAQPKNIRLDFLNTYYASIPCIYQMISGTIDEVLYCVRRFHQEALQVRSSMPFLYDGIVCELIDPYYVQLLGRKNSVNQYMMAIKFQPISQLTRFLGYTFTVGQNGVITPMLHYMPVTLMGTTHTKTTGHSYKRFMELGLKKGDIVEITYRNDVIPYATKPCIPDNSYNPNPVIPFPTVCPECGAPLQFYGDHATCNNANCPGRLLSRNTEMLNRLGITDMGDERVKALGFRSFVEFVNMDADRIYKALGNAIGNSLIDQINNLLKNPINDYDIIGALGFTGMAQKTWQLVLTHITLAEILNLNDMDLYMRLSPVKGIGDKKINVIKNERVLFGQDLAYILCMPNVIQTMGNATANGKRIVITGVRDSDGSLARLIKSVNPSVQLTDSSVTKTTSLLLVPTMQHQSNKVSTAIKYGIPIVDINTFRNNVRSYI